MACEFDQLDEDVVTPLIAETTTAVRSPGLCREDRIPAAA